MSDIILHQATHGPAMLTVRLEGANCSLALVDLYPTDADDDPKRPRRISAATNSTNRK